MTIRARSLANPGATTVDTMQALKDAIASAAANGTQVRVRGAKHSVRAAIEPDPGRGVELLLGADFQEIERNPTDPTLVQVGAGRRLGGDPDEAVPATDGVLWWLAQQQPPWGVPDLGGITHQTVGGFLSTGSSGGSLQYSLEDAIESITFVDGTGQEHTVGRSMPDDDFPAVGVSMGLLGVITGVELRPMSRFAIAGTESTTTIDQAAFAPFAPGPSGLEAFLRAEDYCRIMWWPQPKVDRLVTWRASRMDLAPGFVPNPYRELGDPDEDPVSFPPELSSVLLPRLVAAVAENIVPLVELFATHRDALPGVMVEFLDNAVAMVVKEGAEGLKKVVATVTASEIQEIGVDLYFTLLGNRVTNPLARSLFTTIFESEAAFEATWSPLIMNGIFLVTDDRKVKPGPQVFQDYADTGLPMDDQISDLLMPTEFTELWIPIERSVDVMTALRDHYGQGGYAATGTYACEIYGTKASDFWMSPAYDRDVVRIDLFWFARNGDQTAEQFYGPFWDLLRAARLPFRPHWGKLLPPAATFGADYYRGVYPKLDAFLSLRQRYDPRQVFVTDYWREQLGIARP